MSVPFLAKLTQKFHGEAKVRKLDSIETSIFLPKFSTQFAGKNSSWKIFLGLQFFFELLDKHFGENWFHFLPKNSTHLNLNRFFWRQMYIRDYIRNIYSNGYGHFWRRLSLRARDFCSLWKRVVTNHFFDDASRYVREIFVFVTHCEKNGKVHLLFLNWSRLFLVLLLNR